MKNNIFITKKSFFFSEFIGYVFYILPSSYNDDRMFVVKKNSLELILLSNERFFFHSLYNLHRERVSNKGFFFYISFFSIFEDIRFLNFSLFIQFGFFSQLEWRYIRHFLYRLGFKLTVIHSGFFDLALRNRNSFFSLANVFSGHQLLLHSYMNSLNVFSFFFSINNLFVFFFRSRDEENYAIGMDDHFSNVYQDNSENCLHISNHDSFFDDFSMDIHFSVEQQLIAGGFFFYGSVFHLDSVSFLFSLSFFDYYLSICNFFLFIPSNFFFFFSYSYFFFSLYFFSILFFFYKLIFINSLNFFI